MSLCVGSRPTGGESRELKAGGGEEGRERWAEQASPQGFGLAVQNPALANRLHVCTNSEPLGGKWTTVLDCKDSERKEGRDQESHLPWEADNRSQSCTQYLFPLDTACQ